MKLEKAHKMPSTIDNRLIFQPNNMTLTISAIIIMIPILQLSYYSFPLSAISIIFIPFAVPIIFLEIWLIKLIKRNRYPLIIDNFGIEYGIWESQIGTNFVSWNNISKVSEFRAKGYRYVLLEFKSNVDITNDTPINKIVKYLKLNKLFGDVCVCTNHINGRHNEIFDTISTMHKKCQIASNQLDTPKD